MGTPQLLYTVPSMVSTSSGMKVFAIYNRNYNARNVLASDKDEAVRLAQAYGHMRSIHHVRRIAEVTEELLATPEGAASLQALIAQATPGVIQAIEGEGWILASR